VRVGALNISGEDRVQPKHAIVTSAHPKPTDGGRLGVRVLISIQACALQCASDDGESAATAERRAARRPACRRQAATVGKVR